MAATIREVPKSATIRNITHTSERMTNEIGLNAGDSIPRGSFLSSAAARGRTSSVSRYLPKGGSGDFAGRQRGHSAQRKECGRTVAEVWQIQQNCSYKENAIKNGL